MNKIIVKEKNSGITLIALVITIIVLLILAGVSVAMLTGESGVISKATETKQQHEMAAVQEQVKLVQTDVVAEEKTYGKDLSESEIIEKVKKDLQIPDENVNGNLLTTSDDKHDIMVFPDGKIEVVKKGEGYVDAKYLPVEPEENFKWKVLDDNTVNITGYTGNSKNIHFPDQIDGKDVSIIDTRNDLLLKSVKSISLPSKLKGIGYMTFYGNKLTNVEFPDSIVRIGDGAFSSNKIRKIVLPKNLEIIGDYKEIEKNDFSSGSSKPSNSGQVALSMSWGAFAFNDAEEIVFNDKLKVIGNSTFSYNNLKDINIPKSVNRIGPSAFNNNLLNYEDAIVYYRNLDSSINKKIIVSYGGTVKDIVIPNGVEILGYESFRENDINKIVIPASVKKIEGLALFNNFNLNDITFLGDVPSIANSIIQYNEKLKIKVPNKYLNNYKTKQGFNDKGEVISSQESWFGGFCKPEYLDAFIGVE